MPPVIDHHICRFDVPVQDLVGLPRVLKRICEKPHDLQCRCLIKIKFATLLDLFQVGAVDIFHEHIGAELILPGVIDLDYIFVVQ